MSQLNKSAVIETGITPEDQLLDVYKCDVVFSFDCTGSMSSIIDSVRRNLVETIDKLFTEVPGIRIGILAHADYCDYPRMFWKIELCNNPEKLKDFIKSVPNGGGGDAPECYELAIQQANLMKWRSDIKVFVIIGDELPHEEGYEMPHLIPGFDSELHINWENELKSMIENKITCFSCHALADENQHSVDFYQKLSEKTGGYYIPLIELGSFNQYMVGICLRAADTAENFEAILDHQRKLLEDLKKANKEEKQKIEEEITNTQHAIHEARTTSFFASPKFEKLSTDIRSKNGTNTNRMRSYETEIKTKYSNRSESIDYFFDSVNTTSSQVKKIDPRMFTVPENRSIFKSKSESSHESSSPGILSPLRTTKKTRKLDFTDLEASLASPKLGSPERSHLECSNIESEPDTQEPW